MLVIRLMYDSDYVAASEVEYHSKFINLALNLPPKWQADYRHDGITLPTCPPIYTLEVCRRWEFPWVPWVPWESHGNGNKGAVGMGMGMEMGKLMGMGGNGSIRFSKIFPLSWVSHWLWRMIVLVLQLCILGLLLPKKIHRAN